MIKSDRMKRYSFLLHTIDRFKMLILLPAVIIVSILQLPGRGYSCNYFCHKT